MFVQICCVSKIKIRPIHNQQKEAQKKKKKMNLQLAALVN
jgi:hypothetical protein